MDAITIADCPIGRPRADSSLLACKLHRELKVNVLPHLTCRDRNLNATKALLLGLSMEGVDNVLLVTGDPIPGEDRDSVKSVFNFNSRKLAAYVTSLQGTALKQPMHLFGALNVNAVNFDVQLRLAREKVAAGVEGFLTQPVLSAKAMENLRKAREELQGSFILAGLYPIVSYRNACFLQNEVSGMRIDEDIALRYRDKSREEAEEIALSVTLDLARQAAPYADGFYVTVPFRRMGLMERIAEAFAQKVLRIQSRRRMIDERPFLLHRRQLCHQGL